MPLGASVDEAKEVLRRELQAALDQQNELARRALLSSGAHFDRAYLVKLRAQLRALADRQGVAIATGKYSDLLEKAFAKGAADGKAALGEVDPAILDLAVNNAEVRVKGILDDGIKVVNEEMVKATLGTSNLADISERLQSKLTLKDGGGIQEWRADLIAGTELHSVYRQAQLAAGKANGVEWYEYAGPDDNRTEPICAEYVGKVLTLEEWRDISAKEQGDPEIIFLYGLHYGCRHTLKPAAPPPGEAPAADAEEAAQEEQAPPEPFDAGATEAMMAEEAYARREASLAQAEADAYLMKPMVEQEMQGAAEAKYLADWQEAKDLETKKKAWKKYGDKKAAITAQKKLDYAKQGYAAAQDAYAQGATSKSVVTKWKKKYEAAIANAQAKGIATDAPPPAPAAAKATPAPAPPGSQVSPAVEAEYWASYKEFKEFMNKWNANINAGQGNLNSDAELTAMATKHGQAASAAFGKGMSAEAMVKIQKEVEAALPTPVEVKKAAEDPDAKKKEYEDLVTQYLKAQKKADKSGSDDDIGKAEDVFYDMKQAAAKYHYAGGDINQVWVAKGKTLPTEVANYAGAPLPAAPAPQPEASPAIAEKQAAYNAQVAEYLMAKKAAVKSGDALDLDHAINVLKEVKYKAAALDAAGGDIHAPWTANSTALPVEVMEYAQANAPAHAQALATPPEDKALVKEYEAALKKVMEAEVKWDANVDAGLMHLNNADAFKALQEQATEAKGKALAGGVKNETIYAVHETVKAEVEAAKTVTTAAPAGAPQEQLAKSAAAEDALVKLNTVKDFLEEKMTTGTLAPHEWTKLKAAAQEAVAAGINLSEVFPNGMPTYKSPVTGKTFVMTAKGTGTTVKGTGTTAAPAAVPAPTPIVDAGPPMPTDPETILGQKIKDPTGSNTGGVSGSWMGTDGTLRYVKEYANPDQARGEVLANELYRALGVHAPRSTMFQTKDGKWAIASDWQANKGELGKLGITKERALKVLEGTPVDILLGNRDAVGLNHDNVVFDADGNAWRIDQGGALLFKAQGQEKSSNALATISEWEYFTQGKTYKKVFDAAGVETTGDIAGVWDKIKQIEDMRTTYGSWTNRISMLHPDWNPDLVKKMGDVLDNRTDQLRQKRMDHEAQVRLANAPPAKVTGKGIPLPPGGPSPVGTQIQDATMDDGLFHPLKSLGNGYLTLNAYGYPENLVNDLDAQNVLEVTWQAMKRDYTAGLKRLIADKRNNPTETSTAGKAVKGYRKYTAGDYELMNIATNKAMTNKPMDAQEQKMWKWAQAMETYMGKATGEFVIWRGEGSSSNRAHDWGRTLKAAAGKDTKIGQNRFLSTSIKEDVARTWGGFLTKKAAAAKATAGRDFENAHRETGFLYEITVKPGCPGIYIAPNSSSGQGEYEFIIGTKAKYRILGMERIYGGWKVRMEAY